MSENQVIRSRRRATIFEGTDLPVGTTEAYLVHSEKHLACALQLWLGQIDELKLFLRWEHCQSLHGVTSSNLRAVA